jgi:hypothetical protein
MKRMLLIVAALALLVPATARCQAAETVRVGSTHSALAAGLLEWVFPTAGFAYAGDWKRGLLPNVLRVGSYVGFVATADWISGGNECEGDAACVVFGLSSVATTVWAIVGAVHAAQDYNASIVQQASGLFVQPSGHGGVAVGFRIAP